MADTEEYFPRGGKKQQPTYFKQSSNFLGVADKTEKKKKKPKKKSEGDDGYLSDDIGTEYEQSIKNCAVGINSQTVKEGTLILGRVHQVFETKLHISLPCKLQGTVMACHISEAYNKLLESYVNDEVESVRELSKMFRPGQYVATKVLEVDKNLMLTLMPQHINSGRLHTDLQKGTLLQAAVSSVEDHGYVMDLGIPNTRAFLPTKNVNPEIELDTGALTWVTVKKSAPTADSSIVTVSNQLLALQEAVCKKTTARVATLTPGTAFEFHVDKALDNGIEGSILSSTTSYIQRAHTDSVKGKKPALGQRVRARLLYELPTRKTPFLTMRNIFETTYPDLEKERKYKKGDVVENAQVIKITARALVFRLGKRGVGHMSLRRVAVEDDVPPETIIAKSYPLGSEHTLRVLSYNMSDYNYSVTDERQVLAEKYFDLTDLTVGETVTATVKEVADSHVMLTLGRLTGMVPHAHITDSGVYIDRKKGASNKVSKKKYKVGQQVEARVLVVVPDTNTLLLTLKPSLMADSVEPLSSYDDALVGKAYTGVIKYIKDTYIIVSFFGNVVAYVPRQYVTRDEAANIADCFHVGQIVSCTILKVYLEDKKMTGSLTTTPFWPEKKREKRKKSEQDTDTAPSKKRKTSESSDTEPPKNKKDKKQKKLNKEVESQEKDSKKSKKNKSKKTKGDEEAQGKVSEESDAIETDLPEGSEQILQPQDLRLIDLSGCDNYGKCKKRILSLIASVKARNTKLQRIDNKIAKIEEAGLDVTNKKIHTAMHTEKLIVEERLKALLDALQMTQEKLKNYPKKEKPEKKKKKEGKNDEEVEEIVKDVKVVDKNAPVLEIPSVADFWSMEVDAAPAVQDDSSSSEDEAEEQTKKKRKKLTAAEKVAKERAEEERLRRLEREAVEGAAQPRSVDQFERAVLANPDCSQIWIAYCAFHLQSTELEKARAVCRRALAAISFRAELERRNVWLALLGLEHRFGTQESQQKTLEEALQMNDTFQIHCHLLDILVDTCKLPELSSLVDLMTRKYKRDPNTYIVAGGACYKLGMVDKARQVMQKAMVVLDKKEHVNVLVQFALLERSSGSVERAEALFEQILGLFPQRVDVASVYVDMLLKAGDMERVRQVLERMTSQKLPARKMKVLYKKWIEVEEKNGDEQQIEKIRQKAMDFIENAKF